MNRIEQAFSVQLSAFSQKKQSHGSGRSSEPNDLFFLKLTADG